MPVTRRYPADLCGIRYNSLGHPTTACMPRLFTHMYAVVALGTEKRWTNPAPLSNVAQAIHRDTATAFDVTAADGDWECPATMAAGLRDACHKAA